MTRVNQSWREQAKAIKATSDDGQEYRFKSLWEAATEISNMSECKFATARKEIKKALKTGVSRYGLSWQYV